MQTHQEDTEAFKQQYQADREKGLVVRLGLSFCYDWSNPNLSDQSLIINVLKRTIFEDICRICAYFGVDKVDSYAVLAFEDEPSLIYQGMIDNIRIGFSRDV